MRIEDFQLGDVTDYSSLMFIKVLSNHADGLSDEQREEAKLHIPLGYVCVIDPKFGDRAQHKMPAGHSKPGETPLDTVIREVQGETGIPVPKERVTYVAKQLGYRKDHWRILFVGHIFEHELRYMHDRDVENEGEKPKYFTVDEFYECVRNDKFMRAHYSMLREYNLILPFGRAEVA